MSKANRRRRSRHGLRFQMLLVLKLFVVCIVAAGYLVYQRSWVESFMKEQYSPPPPNLQSVINAVIIQQPINKLYAEIPDPERVYLFDYWMATEPVQTHLPRQLLELDTSLFLTRAERSLISGSPEQRLKALKFIDLGDQPSAIPILEKAQRWAQRRTFDELAEEIGSVIEKLQS